MERFDILGVRIKIGDNVIAHGKGKHEISLFKIVRFTPQGVRLENLIGQKKTITRIGIKAEVYKVQE